MAGTVLVIAPHAVDEILGCGGTMALEADKGRHVETLVLFGDGSGADAKRRKAAEHVSRELGLCTYRYGGFPENCGDTIALSGPVSTVEKAIADIKPDTLYVPHGASLHIDHQISYRAAVTAARPLPGMPVRSIFSYEILSSSEWALGPSVPFAPLRIVDIGTTIERKFRALQFYESELRPAPHNRSLEGVRALARHRGLSVGFDAAEGFGVLRELIP